MFGWAGTVPEWSDHVKTVGAFADPTARWIDSARSLGTARLGGLRSTARHTMRWVISRQGLSHWLFGRFELYRVNPAPGPHDRGAAGTCGKTNPRHEPILLGPEHTLRIRDRCRLLQSERPGGFRPAHPGALGLHSVQPDRGHCLLLLGSGAPRNGWGIDRPDALVHLSPSSWATASASPPTWARRH